MSTETALFQFVKRLERCLEHKEIASGAFLDIEGAIDNTFFHSDSRQWLREVQRPRREQVTRLLVDRLGKESESCGWLGPVLCDLLTRPTTGQDL
jgi:hypothetical protein